MTGDERSLVWKLKMLVWSVSAGTIVAFFFSSNFLSWATGFNPGGSALLVSPVTCGFILGLVSWEREAIHTVFGTFILTATATVGVILTLLSPMLFGVAWVPDEYYIFVSQNTMITVILVLPISLLGAMVGRLFAESTIMSKTSRSERAALRKETEAWYRMLEEKLEEKRSALEELMDRHDDMESPEFPLDGGPADDGAAADGEN